MTAKRTARLLMFIFYSVALIAMGWKVVEMSGKLAKYSDQMTLVSARIEVLEDERDECLAFFNGIVDDVLAKRYCFREEEGE